MKLTKPSKYTKHKEELTEAADESQRRTEEMETEEERKNVSVR